MTNMDIENPSEQFLEDSVLQRRRWLKGELTQYKVFCLKSVPLFYLKYGNLSVLPCLNTVLQNVDGKM